MNTMIQKLCILLSACLMGNFLSAQVPSITSFAPNFGPIGTTVTITGTNFNLTAANNIVYFGAVRATVNLSTATTLTVVVPSGANYQPISVLNTATGLHAQSTLPFRVTFSSGISITSMSFAAKVDSAAASRPSGLAVGDMDGNGKTDLVMAHSISQAIRIYTNNSTGNAVSFNPRFTLILNAGATGVAVDDLDGDGKMDIAAVSSTAGRLFLFRNTTTGNTLSFATRIDSVAGSSAQAVAIGDLDLDGKPDLAIANSSAGTVSVLRNTSTPGNLSFASRVTFTVGSQPFTVAIGDIDGDGKLDVVTGNAQSGTISVLRNTNAVSGTLSLAPKADFDAGGFPFGATLADIDGDGKLDAMVVDQGVKLSILRNTSSIGVPGFAPKVDFNTGSTGAAPIRIATGDIDGDGKVDIAVSNSTGNTAAIFKNNSTSGSIVLAAKIDLTTGTNPFAGAIVDLTGDDQPDYAVINQNSNTVSVFRTQLSLPPSLISFSPTTGGPGDTIVITGNNLVGVTKVTFGDSIAAFFQVVNPLQIKAVVGTGATGDVDVFINGDTLTLPGFIYTNCPTTLVAITAMPGDTICPGSSATFKAHAVAADPKPTFEWYLNGDLVGRDTVLTIDTLANLDTVVCIVRDTCGVAPRTDRDTIIMHLRTLPTLTSTLTPPAVCSGTAFAYTPTSNVPGTTYQWRRKAVTGISNVASTGMGPINETLNDTTANPVTVTYEIFKLSAKGCTRLDTFKVTVQVKPIPKLTSSVAAVSICTGATFNYTPTSSTTGATITWSRAFVNGVSNSSNTGTGLIAESLNNTGATSVKVTYRFQLTANGCTKPISDSLILTVSPIPQVTSGTTAPAICSGTAFTYVPTSNLTGATFNWKRMAVTGISNATRMDTGRINEILFDTTANPVNVIYQYTATLGGCPSPTPVNVTVAVNPSPLMSSTLNPAAICSGTTFAYTPTSNNNNINFTWTRAAVTGISNVAANGTGAVSEILRNTTADTVAVVYAYVISASGCSDPNPKNVTVLVKPIPTLNSTPAPPAICSGTLFSYTPTSATEGTTFIWSRPAITGLSNIAATGTGNPNEILIDTTSISLSVPYEYALSAYGCTNPNLANIKVVVNLPPSLSSSRTPAGICSGAVFNYTPTSAVQNTNFAWTRAAVTGISNAAGSGSGNPNEALTNTTGLPINVTYVYTLSAGGCANAQTFNVVVSVRPYPALISEVNPAAICSGNAFNYTPISGNFDATFAWTRAAVTGISNLAANGSDNPNEVLENTTTNAINVVYAFTVSSGGCSNPTPINVTISVKPSPRLTSSVNVADICSGTAFNYAPTSNVANTTFAWTRATVNGISNALGSGSGPINEVLTSTAESSLSVFYQYTLTANGCAAALPSAIEVTVKPLPVLSSATIAPGICSGETFSYLPKSLTAGTAFSWTRAAVQGISAAAASGTGNPAEALTNTTNSSLTVIYVYHLSANSCANSVGYNIEVNVNPLPVLTSAASASEMCSGQIFSYTPSSSVPNTTFNWTRASVTGISNAAGSGTSNPNEILQNTTTAPITVTYVYSLNVGGCVNAATYTVTVVVNSKPTLNSTVNPPAICSGTVFNYTPSSSTTGVNFSWSRQAVNGISNAVATGTGNPNETLTNTTAQPINVTYVYLLSANACANTISNSVVVTVNPLPSLNSELALNPTCSGGSFTYLPTSATENTNFAWSRAAVQGISNVAATGTGGVSETLTSTSNAPITVSYIFTLSANGCSNAATFTVNKLINPIPTLTSNLNPAALCSGTTLAYAPTGSVNGTTYTWTRAAVNGISNPAANGTGDINEVLLNTTTGNLNVVYQYTLSANGCSNPNNAQVTVGINAKPIVVTHNPAPRCTTLVNLREAAVTAGSSADLTFTYWTDAAATVPFNSPQSADAGIYYIKGTTTVGCFEVKPVTVVVGRIPDALANGKTICSGIPADITVLNPNAAPGATFNWTATYGRARVGLGSGSGVPFGLNAIDELLINLTRKRTEVTYTITPVGAQASGCVGEPITVKVKLNSGGRPCPEAEPTAFRETIAHNTAPQTKVNMVKPKKRKKYLVQAISNLDSVEGVSEAPYTRPRGAVFEVNALQNKTRQPATVVYNIVAYTNGRNWRDNNGSGDDVLGASFDVVVTVQGSPGFTEPALPEIASQPKVLDQKQSVVNKPTQLQNPIAPALLDYMVEAAQQPAAEKVVLLQNVPNPFQGNTQIGFYLPEAAQTKLSIRDVKGAVLYQVQGNYSKGWNLLELSAADLRVSGVLYYSLETAKFVETKRMVVLK